MRRNLLPLTIAWLALGIPAPASPDLLDRMAVRVGKDVITEGEVLDEIRLTAFLNGSQSNLNPASRREAAERLVDQHLIRQEMALSNYPAPPAKHAEQLLLDLKKRRFSDDAAYRAALTRYGITQDQLKEHLLWQLAALRFTETRFGSESPRPPEEHAREAVKSDPAILAWPVPNGSAGDAPASVDREMEGWLKDARQRTKVEFYKEAFE